MMKDDPQLGRSFQRFNFEVLKDRTVDFFLADWAGETWEGRPLFQAHASLHITVEMFERDDEMHQEDAEADAQVEAGL